MLRTEKDFAAFDRIILEAHERFPIRILSYCLMGNHWHFVVWPERDGQLTAFFRWLTHTHAMRWRVAHHTVGYGHLYQGRFKSFPVQEGASLLKVCRYVERNALTAGLVTRAEEWRWSSLWVRQHGSAQQQAVLSPWARLRPADWVERVNRPLTEKEATLWKNSLARSRPFGDDRWTAGTVQKLGLMHTIRGEGGNQYGKKDERH
jgi:putative transposase